MFNKVALQKNAEAKPNVLYKTILHTATSYTYLIA